MTPTLRQFSEYPPLTLYVHFPWCVKKCPYCDFNSHVAVDDIPESAYVDALIADLEAAAPDIWGRAVETVFFGGGTPSLMSEKAVDKLLGKIRALTRLQPDAEITLEANPGAVDQARFAEYRAAGINRLSIGVQSFNDSALNALGRVHNGGQARDACETIHRAGYENFNIDLMHGLPAQQLEDAMLDLSTAVALAPSHVSYYQLTIEPNTLFAAQPPRLPQDETLWDIQSAGHALLSRHGFHQYEVSAFASEGKRCQHNLNYWLFGDYLGIGAGAHSKLTFPAQSSIVRKAMYRHPKKYMQLPAGNPRCQSVTTLMNADSRLEFMMNALRLNDGFERSLFMTRTGESLQVLSNSLQKGEQLLLLEQDYRKITPTQAGLMHLNTLLELFMPEDHLGSRPIAAEPIAITGRAAQKSAHPNAS